MEDVIKTLGIIDEISDDDLKNMDFYETALYVQTLNQMECMYDELMGDNNEQ